MFSSLEITKNVKGNLGDLTKEFAFTAKFTGLEPEMTYGVDNNGAILIEGFSDPDIIIKAPPGPKNASEDNADNTDNTSAKDTGLYLITSDEDGKASVRFSLLDECGLSFRGLPAGATFSITEDKSDHFPEYHVTGEGGTLIKEDSRRTHTSLSTGVISMQPADNYKAEFINSRDLAPVTGVAASAAPLAAIISAAAVICVLLRRISRKL